MSLRRAAIAAFGGALLLVTASTVNAQAADGPFSYGNPGRARQPAERRVPPHPRRRGPRR